MNNKSHIETMGQVAEHSLYKAFAPVVTTLLLGCVGWLFMTLIDVQTNVRILTEANIPTIQNQIEVIIADNEENIEDLEADIDQLYEVVTNIRIQQSRKPASLQWPLP